MNSNQAAFRVVVDSNVFIAAALAIKHGRRESANYQFFEMLFENGVESVASDATLYELGDKLQEPRFAFSGAFVTDFLALIAAASTIVPIRGLSYPCRDPKDSKFIETAVNGRVNFLVTYDKDLHDADAARELEKRGCEVVTVRDFLSVVADYREQLTPNREGDT
jgi:putative PIN family toxin of toxin-antitoxin system